MKEAMMILMSKGYLNFDKNRTLVQVHFNPYKQKESFDVILKLLQYDEQVEKLSD